MTTSERERLLRLDDAILGACSNLSPDGRPFLIKYRIDGNLSFTVNVHMKNAVVFCTNCGREWPTHDDYMNDYSHA